MSFLGWCSCCWAYCHRQELLAAKVVYARHLPQRSCCLPPEIAGLPKRQIMLGATIPKTWFLQRLFTPDAHLLVTELWQCPLFWTNAKGLVPGDKILTWMMLFAIESNFCPKKTENLEFGVWFDFDECKLWALLTIFVFLTKIGPNTKEHCPNQHLTSTN